MRNNSQDVSYTLGFREFENARTAMGSRLGRMLELGHACGSAGGDSRYHHSVGQLDLLKLVVRS